MQPSTYELDQLADAFLTIGRFRYTSDQNSYLMQFLHSYGKDLNEANLRNYFSKNEDVAKALHELHEYANRYEKEKKPYNDFKEEIEFLLSNLNNTQGDLFL